MEDTELGHIMSISLPDPKTSPELFEGLLTRRVMAYLFDIVIISVITIAFMLATFVVGILTLGLAWLTLPIVAPLAVLIYYVATLGSPTRATIGMRMFDIVLTPTSGPPMEGWKALIHPFVFWLTIWIFWPLLLVGLFTQRRQLVHDLITKTLMVRRSPMEKHWNNSGKFNGFTA